MKFAVKSLKPRNPLVSLARMRRAGSHRSGGRSLRQRGDRALQRELDQMRHSP